MKMKPYFANFLLLLAILSGSFFCGFAKAQTNDVLWKIGTKDNSDSDFALSDGDYDKFLETFGSPDKTFYIGLSNPKTDWPCVLPGPMDVWAGSHYNPVNHSGWDQLNTLSIGFVLHQAPAFGQCALIINVGSAPSKYPPTLRVTINGLPFDRNLSGSGADSLLNGHIRFTDEQVLRVDFPSSLLKKGYNEITLRSTKGSWMLFDELHLETPADVELAQPSNTIIRSINAAPYTVSSNPKTPATVRIEIFHAGQPGKIKAEIGRIKKELTVQPGLHVLEVSVPASIADQPTLVRLSANGKVLDETQLHLTASPHGTPADYVDVFMGTAHSRWMIAPGPWMPFSMVKISPDNQRAGWCSGYEFSHEYIDCFSHIHEWTMAGLGMMPTIGPLRTHPGLDGTGYSSHIDKSTEHGGIGFYEVFLKDSGIKVELTATTRASLQRYTFPASDQAKVLYPFLLPNEYEMHIVKATVRRTGPAEIEGTIETDFPNVGYNGHQRFNLHFVSQFSSPFDTLGGWDNLEGEQVTMKRGEYRPPQELDSSWQGPKVIAGVQQVDLSGDCGAFVSFKTTAGEKIEVRTGISLVSIDDARMNLEHELSGPFGWDFQAVVRNQRRAWNKIFDRVEITTSDAREKTRFYTNMYRALSGRNTWSDVNGEWMDPDGNKQKVANPEKVMLGSDALWTTFWNLNQVMNLIAPEWSVRWTKSELQLYEKCGWLAKGPAGLKYISVMVAEHEIPLMVAAYQHGLKVDPNKILTAAVKMQTTPPEHLPNGGAVGNANLENYLKYGYVAEDGPIGPGGNNEWKRAWTSNTYEYAYDDWCVAQLARAIGRKKIYDEFMKRSRSWQNVFDAKIGFARPRKMDGEWLSPFDPYRTSGFVEGNAWQYTWFVPQDVPGLIKVMGRDRFVSRLNEGFEQSVPDRFNGASSPVNHGNQPTMEVSWLFNWAGQPWLTQKWVHAILSAYYGFNPADAYLGDEDQGQMSSWFVMSSIGLFELDGGCRVNPIYEIGSPLYSKIVIHLSKKYYGGKTFIIEARQASSVNCYIQSVSLNGKPLNRWWISQKEILKGGHLVLRLGPAPNKNWGHDSPIPK
jgi:predicted alpha-1,2-mannosidase